jgi:hypothetical protein
MRCQQCRRNKIEEAGGIYSYGGMTLCFSCNERHNPITETVTQLSAEQRERYKDEISSLESKITKIKRIIEQDDKAIEKGGSYTYAIARDYPSN